MAILADVSAGYGSRIVPRKPEKPVRVPLKPDREAIQAATAEFLERGGRIRRVNATEILRELGPFDLDPCALERRPWATAGRHYTVAEDGLAQDWAGRVWLNPPYGAKETWVWVERLARHGDGVALIFARTETVGFHRWVWEKATALLFLEGRLHFCLPDGSRAPANAGGPSVLVAYGDENASRLKSCGLKGAFVLLRRF